MSGSLRIVLGDQLSPAISALRGADKDNDTVFMAEVAAETVYVRHHKKKIAFVLSAMRAFARELREAGWRVDYVELTDPDNSGAFTSEIMRAVARHSPASVITTEAGEHRVLAMQWAWRDQLSCWTKPTLLIVL